MFLGFFARIAIALLALFSITILPCALSAQPAMLGPQANPEQQGLVKVGLDKGQRYDATLRFSPLRLKGGTNLLLVSPREWNSTADRIGLSLEGLHLRFNDMFGDIPAFQSSIRLMEEEMFFRTTGAPRWTNALFLKGEIIIPMSKTSPPSAESLLRTVRHEYAHAVIHAMSNGKCPGWLDEGIAQWAEGKENPALRPALARWLQHQSPVSLSLLQGGFTRLDSQMVPAAYAQSLFAANTVINTFGFEQIRSYLDNLQSGLSSEQAFQKSFRLSEERFETQLGGQLRKWSRSYHKHHHSH